MTRVAKIKRGLWTLAFVVLAGVFARPAHAASSQNLDITVSILASKSLSVNTTGYNFGGMSVNSSSVSVTAVVVTNDSGALIETYTLQGSSAVSTGGGTDWTLAASTGTDRYALSAQFSAAQPANADASWTSDALTYSPVTATASVLGNGNSAESGAAVFPGGARNLWFRIKTPGVVSDATQRKATLTLAVQ